MSCGDSVAVTTHSKCQVMAMPSMPSSVEHRNLGSSNFD